ncbi:MAG: hypothetical protein JSW33_06890 [bacterium]|nr:MAG: hypothetical protein JSW33_06890 [bacterium]
MHSIYLRRYGLFALFLISSQLFSQPHFGGGTARFNSSESRIPFDLQGHRMYVSVKVDRTSRPLSFILDTGAFTSISDQTRQLLDMTRGSSLLPSGQISYAHFLQEPVTLQLGDMAVEEFRLVSMDYTYYYTADPDFHGFLGSDFLKFFYVKIDYGRKEVTLSRKPFPVRESSRTYRIPLDTRNAAFLPRIDCQVDQRWNWSGLIDTGAPFGVIFPMAALDNQRRSRVPLIASKGVFASWPTSKLDKNYLSRVSLLSLGKFELRDFPVIFSNTEDIILGEEFLSHFEVYLHYPDNELILVQQNSLNWKNNFFSIGINLNKNSGNKTIIEGIWEGSPAARAGISLHGEVISLNRQPTSRLSVKELNRILNDDRINMIELVLREGFREKSYTLKKEAILP